MRPVPNKDLLRHIHGLVAKQGLAGPCDGELVRRFVRDADEGAFEALLERHGPMVLRVCRRVLHDLQEAEDAFQATFIVLVRKARSLQRKESVGSWLHGVAYRVALNVRAASVRRSFHESRATPAKATDALAEITLREAQTVLDAELCRLPDKYRAPLVLCCIEGVTRDEAARQLGWSLSTLKSRLGRGRQLLRKRLTRRGLTLSAAFTAIFLSRGLAQARLPGALVSNTLQAVLACLGRSAGRLAAGQAAVAGVLSARDVAISEGVLRTMFLTKITVVSAVLLAFGLVGIGTGAISYRAFAAAPSDPVQKQAPAQIKDLIEQLDSPKFSERQAAASALRQIGQTALPALREAAHSQRALELRRRATEIDKQIMDDVLDKTLKEAANQEEVITKEYKKMADMLDRVTEIGKERFLPDPANAPPQHVPFLADSYLRLARARTKSGEYLRAATAYEEAEKYSNPMGHKEIWKIRQEYGAIMTHLLPVWEAQVREALAPDPGLRALAAKYPMVVLHSRRYASGGGYLRSCYSFIWETADEEKHRNDVQLEFDNGRGNGTFQINMVTNQRNTIADLGMFDFTAEPSLTKANPAGPEPDREEHLALIGHSYLEKVEDTNGNRFFVLFKILAVDKESRYMAFIWRRLPGGKLVRR